MIDYRLLEELRLMIVCQWGEPSHEEIQTMRRKLATDLGPTISYDVLVDASRIDTLLAMNEFGPLLAGRIIAVARPIKLAIISGFEDVAFGVQRQFATLAERDMPDVDIRVFRDLPPALDWLGHAAVDVASLIADMVPDGHKATDA